MELFRICICILLALYLLVLLPFLLGTGFHKVCKMTEKGYTSFYIWGFILEVFVFEIVYTPMVLMKARFSLLVLLLTIIYLVLTFLSLFILRSNRDKMHLKKKDFFTSLSLQKGISLLWIVPFLLIGFQIFMSLFYQYYDGDDAYYLAQSVAALGTNQMYGFDAYTGITTTLDIRHAMAGIPIFISYLSKMTSLHPAIVAHTVFPVFLIILSYSVFYKIGKRLFAEQKEGLPLFMSFMAFFQIFGNSTIFTNETFFLTRTSQGKAIMASFLIPVGISLLLELAKNMEKNKEKGQRKDLFLDIWFRIVILQFTGIACTTLSVYLLPLLLGTGILILVVTYKKPAILFSFLVSLFPSLIYGLLYIMF